AVDGIGGRFYRRLILLRAGSFATLLDHLPCYPGRLWRRATTAVAGHSAGGVSRRKTGTGDGFLGAWNRGRADAWAGGGGVDYRQLQLAMGVLHQCPDRRY